MVNWKTTLAGSLGALGVYFSTVPDPKWLQVVGQVLVGLGSFLTGLFAKDFNVSNAQTPGPAAPVAK